MTRLKRPTTLGLTATIVAAAALSLSACVPHDCGELPTEPPFVSDYLSFIGLEGTSPVLVVMERRKVRGDHGAKDDYRAAIYDNDNRWIDLSRHGRHVASGEAEGQSTFLNSFHVSGEPSKGLTIASEDQLISLALQPVAKQLSSVADGDGSDYQVETAAALLTWGPRVIKGWAVHEHLTGNLHAPWRQQLTGTPFHHLGRIFLRLGHSGLLYVHTEAQEFANGPSLGSKGFMVLGGEVLAVSNVMINVKDREFGAGLYTWPAAGELAWTTAKGPAKVSLRTVEKIALANWLVGGSILDGIVGDLTFGTQRLPAYGTSQMIK